MAKCVTVGCRLPNGIILEHPSDPRRTVTLRGLNEQPVVGVGYQTTEVPADFWDAWSLVHCEFPAVRNGAIFVAKDEREVVAVAKDAVQQKTGFERMDQNAEGVKPASKDA